MTDATPHILELHAGSLRLALRPDLGGTLAGLWHGNTPVMRSSDPATLESSRAGACYPLVPYSNRVGHRRFEWQGKAHTTAANFGDNPHSVHGVAWLRAWEVVSATEQDAELRYRHQPDAHWPFAFEVLQQVSLTPQGMTLRLAITNTDAQTQPVGLGWHPYFPKRTQSHIRMAFAHRWDSDAEGLPTGRTAQAGIAAPTATLDFDNCFDGWDGSARIDDELLSLQLSSTLSDLVIYTPQDKPYYCVEPVSHVSNAIQMADPLAHGLRALAPGEVFDASMTLQVSAR